MGIELKIKVGVTTITAISAAVFLVPVIGAQTASQLVQTQWTEAAVEFRASDKGPVQFTEIKTPRLRDAASISPLSSVSFKHRRWATQSASEFQCLAEAVYYEARSESRSGQLAVADVVKNRVRSKHYPNSICSVVYQGEERPFACQFSFACDGSMDLSPKGTAWQRAQDIAQLSLTGFVPDLTKNSTHYHTVEVEPNWAETLEFKTVIGFHKFYRPSWRERNSGGTASIAIAPPS